MTKIYSKKASKNNVSLNPEPETVDFLLKYSKSLSVVKSKKYSIEINKN